MSLKQYHQKVRVHFVDEYGTHQIYTLPSTAAAMNVRLLQSSCASGKRMMMNRMSRIDGKPVMSTAALVRADGSPAYLSFQEANNRGYVIFCARQTKGCQRKKFNSDTLGIELAYQRAVDHMVLVLELNSRQKRVLEEAYPSFLKRYILN